MCGIAGIVSPYRLDDGAHGRALKMRSAIAHRGPDETGLYIDEYAVLVHNRLSIVDVGGGHQPLSNEDETIWIAYNGELYNHAELRVELEGRGHRYRTKSDTETIVHAYEQWGDRCVDQLRGMFAFAIWDAPKRRLLLARDRLGIKPLYWGRAGESLVFGSEIKAILASGLVVPEANTSAIPEVLSTRYTAGAETLFRGIFKLLPGHTLAFSDGAVSTKQYWDVPVRDGNRAATHDLRPSHPGDVAAAFRRRLEESVRIHLMSDVPLGMFLSGGIDSSAVAAIMARQLDRPLQTFSVAFKDRAFNELGYAREVAQAIGAESHEIVIDDNDFFGAVPKLVWHEDEPLAHPSSVPLFFVSTLARQHVTVVLTGEGSDELLAGYGKYPRIALNWSAGGVYERVLPRRWRQAVGRAASILPSPLGRYVRRSFLAMDRSAEAMYLDNFAAIRIADQHRLLAPGLRDAATAAHAYQSSMAYFEAPGPGASLLDRLLYADMKTYLVELLMKQDQMSMAASLESRVPFLDHELVTFAAQLPDEWKLRGWTTKRVLREAMVGLLPESILNRPKMGFPVPFGVWARGSWNTVLRDVLLDRRSRERGIIDPTAVDALLHDHAIGRTAGADRLWSLFNLELWYRTFIDKQGVQVLPHAHPLAQIGSAAAA